MKAVILAGGEGTRLRDVIKDIPKPMAPVGERPFMEYLILQLRDWDIRDITLSIGYRGDVIKSYFGAGEKWGVRISYSGEREPLGTGGALKKAGEMIDEEDFIVMNGDSFLGINFNDLIDFHKYKSAEVTMGLIRVSDTSRYGRVEIGSDQEIEGFVEKGTSIWTYGDGFINGGVYILNRNIINIIPSGKVSLERDVLPVLIRKGLYGMVTEGYFVDIGVPFDYLSLCRSHEKMFQGIRECFHPISS